MLSYPSNDKYLKIKKIDELILKIKTNNMKPPIFQKLPFKPHLTDEISYIIFINIKIMLK